MSFNRAKILSLAGGYVNNMDVEDLRSTFHDLLDEGIHGICFSLYERGQKPGDVITRAQVERRMEILRPHVKWVRSFACTDGNELVPEVAKEKGLKTLVGAWLGSDREKNREEIAALVRLAKAGMVDIAVVGNEVLYRKDLSEEELLAYIREVKAQLPEIPVGYVDAYYEFDARPQLVDACDLVLANCYPFWEVCAFDYSLMYMQQMYRIAQRAAKGKPVIITETGWPSKGASFGVAVPSSENALKYFINTQKWAREDQVDIFYFSSFDEAWKIGAEGDVGAYWGLWDMDEKLKW